MATGESYNCCYDMLSEAKQGGQPFDGGIMARIEPLINPAKGQRLCINHYKSS